MSVISEAALNFGEELEAKKVEALEKEYGLLVETADWKHLSEAERQVARHIERTRESKRMQLHPARRLRAVALDNEPKV